MDFFTSYANVTGDSITVRTTLVANDSNYLYLDCTSTGTYVYEDIEIANRSTMSLNFLGISILADTPMWYGTMVVESLGSEPFYILNPNDTNEYGQGGSECAAEFTAFYQASWSIPFFYDETAEVLVSPYANYWHNDHVWYLGWNSHLTIINNGTQAVTYDIHYVRDGSWGARSYDPNDCGSETMLNEYIRTDPIAANGGIWSGDLASSIFGVGSGPVVADDGFIYIAQVGQTIGGTYPIHDVTPNASGTPAPEYCRSPNCYLKTSCSK
jgi:hypothetical protein